MSDTVVMQQLLLQVGVVREACGSQSLSSDMIRNVSASMGKLLEVRFRVLSAHGKMARLGQPMV